MKRDDLVFGFILGAAFGAVLMWLWLSPSLVSAAPAPMTWSTLQRQFQRPVEQQTPGGATQPDRSLWVTNPTPCAWDPDDRIDGWFYGVLQKGQSVTHTECVILDHHNHLVGLEVGEGLAGRIQLSESLGPTFGGSTSADVCLLTPQYDKDDLSSLPLIEGSNGGHGDWVEATWSVTNIAGHRLGKALAFTTIHLAGACT